VTNGLGGNPNIPPSQPFATPIDSEYAGKEFSVVRPGEKKKRMVGKIESGEQSAFLRYADTDQAGPYQLFIEDEPKPKAVFAVQGDPKESDLTQQPTADLDSLLKADAPPTTGAEGSPEKVAATTEHRRVPGQELWFPLAIAALILALTEMALAHRFSQSK